MSNEIKPITSKWVTETGSWDAKTNQFVDRISTERAKEIHMQVRDGLSGKVLTFIGGPTGHESYYIKDILDNTRPMGSSEFCISAGTINRWSACYVPWDDVMSFIKED